MALVTLREILNNRKKGCAVGAFNIHNLEFIMGVVKAAEHSGEPIIMMINEAVLKYGRIDILGAATVAAAKAAKVPIAVMVDHGKDMEFLKQALEAEMDVMYDGSSFSFDVNIKNTREIADYAHERGHSIEGEIGALGLSEDGDIENEQKITTVSEAIAFSKESEVDVLAISVGNAHGLYSGKLQIRIDRIKEINDAVTPLPVVMHGGSDIPVEIVQASIIAGIAKFNIATDLKIAYSQKMKELMDAKELPIQPLLLFPVVSDAVYMVAMEKIALFKGSGK